MVLYRVYLATAGAALLGVLWQIILRLPFNAGRAACCLSSPGHTETPALIQNSCLCSKEGHSGRDRREKVFIAGGGFEKCLSYSFLAIKM